MIAATLAYGTTQTHLLYSEPTCQAAQCSAMGGHGNDGTTLKATARPGVGGAQGQGNPDVPEHQAEGSPISPGSGSPGSQHTSTPAGQSPPTPPAAEGGGQPAPKVAVLFRTLKSWHGGFMAAVTIANHGESALDGWQLWLRYRVTEIDRMWGARWFPSSTQGRNAGMVAAFVSQPKVQPGASAGFTFKAAGSPGKPAGCSFDGYRCSFKTLTGGGNRAVGGHHSHKPGGGKAAAGKPGAKHKTGAKQHKN